MKVILWMATSADGFIATQDGSEDFLSHENWLEFVKWTQKVPGLIWGRKTYQAVIKWPETYLKDLENVQKVVVSQSLKKIDERFATACSPDDALQLFANQNSGEVILSGGSTLNAEFAKRNLIDEIVLNVNSVVLGNGIPLFAAENFQLKLELLSTTKVKEDIIQLHYKVKR